MKLNVFSFHHTTLWSPCRLKSTAQWPWTEQSSQHEDDFVNTGITAAEAEHRHVWQWKNTAWDQWSKNMLLLSDSTADLQRYNCSVISVWLDETLWFNIKYDRVQVVSSAFKRQHHSCMADMLDINVFSALTTGCDLKEVTSQRDEEQTADRWMLVVGGRWDASSAGRAAAETTETHHYDPNTDAPEHSIQSLYIFILWEIMTRSTDFL